MNFMLILLLAFFIYGSIWDILVLGVPTIENRITTIVSISTFFICMICGNYTGSLFLLYLPMLVSLPFIFIPVMSKKMGKADGSAYICELSMFAATSFITNTNNVFLFIYSWLISMVTFIIFCLFTQKRGPRKLPMFPFITLGYIVSLIIYFKL